MLRPTVAVSILLVTLFAALPILASPSVLRLPSGIAIPANNVTNHPNNTLSGWPPPKSTLFHVRADLYLKIIAYGDTVEPSLESEVLEALEMIDLDIETSGDENPDVGIPERTYRWTWVYVLFKHYRRQPPRWLTRKQAGQVIDCISGLTMLYGPRGLKAVAIWDRATGRSTSVELHFHVR